MRNVNFNLAVNLINIGFNERCNTIWINESGVMKVKHLDYAVDNNDICFAIIAPTYSDVFKWFRKNHNLHYVPEPKRHFPDNAVNDIYHYSIIDKDGNDVGYDDGTYIVDETLEEKAVERLIGIIKELKNG
jgi:hypothetical protein